MPRPVGASTTYLPGLDGLRAVAVVAVLGYHFDVPGLGGGLLGVSMFFTLSGFLITGVLLSGWDRTGRIDLRAFWLARSRRLLPALAVVLVAVLSITAVVDRGSLPARWGETVAAALYVSNWADIARGSSYFDAVAGPAPLEHLWSLAVEEQFYLLWPILLLVLLRVTGRRRHRAAGIAAALAVVSFVLLAVLAHPGFDHTRAYEGTDTRAGELLAGAALALVYRPGRIRDRPPREARMAVDAVGIAALGGVAVLILTTTAYSLSLYRGGLLLMSLLTALVLVAVSYPGSLLGRALGIAPLRWIGERSYGIYLWHMPVAVWTPERRAGEPWFWLTAVQVALTLMLAALSWFLIEDPVRRHGFVSIARRTVLHPSPGFRTRAPVAIGAAMVVAVAVTTLSPVTLVSGRDRQLVSSVAAPPPLPATSAAAVPTPARASASAPAAKTRGRTSCTSVVHVGDSTSLGLMDPAYLPNPSDRIDARYRAVGVRSVQTDILGARSIVERYKGQPNAQEATAKRVDAGYAGCWVFAMGTNDTANQYAGSNVGSAERIDRLMKEIGGRPALWLTVRTLRPSGPWSETQMSKWNAALLAACRTYPNMRVYDWAAQVQDSWFGSDGIHFTSAGYRQRARRTAQALTAAFPAGGGSPQGCLLTPH
ncbi:MAG TPA: acyltransferase family protein [Mycobacteriales bacterium]|nr:acyltransferase family protein [Mycobacteriales bacterium]